MKTRPHPPSRAFTLVELLTVIAILALLAALLTASLGAVRNASERASCMANLRALGGAIHAYANDHNQYLPPGNRVGMGNFGRLLSGYIAPMKTTTMSADVFYCPANERAGSPPPDGYPPNRYKGWSGYFFGYLLNASLFRITSSDPAASTYIPDNEGRIKLSAVASPGKIVALMDMPTRQPGVGGPPTSGLANRNYFDPASPQFSLGLVHSGAGNILFLDGHVKAFRRQRLPVMSLPGQTTTWWPEQ